MKTFFKFLALPVICHALVCPQALAKKDKSDDSNDKKKSERSEQAQSGKGNALSRQSSKADNGGKANQPGQRQTINPKQQQPQKQIPQQGKKRDSESTKKMVKPSETKPAPKDQGKKEVRPSKDGSDNTPFDKRKDNDATGKRKDEFTKDKLTKNPKDRGPNKSMTLPGKRPKVPGADKDKKPDRPDLAKRDKKPDLSANAKQRKAEVKKQVVVRPGQNTKKVRRADMENKNTKNWWAHGNNVNSNNRNVRVNNVTNVTNVNNNFRQNVNWSTRRNHWGYNPWWNRPAVRPWYGSSWNGGWSRSYYSRHYHYNQGYHSYRPPGYYHGDNDVAQAIGWGLVGWSLGAMIYDTGYRSYYNPYPVRPVYVSNSSQVTYAEPITQVAVRSAPAEDAAVEEINRKSESLIGESQTAFKQRNYLVALELADKAIAESPGDGALHEYRGLILFALGKYGEAAGVLNPVLASGPGWDWSTMIALYDAQETYTDQLQRLEAYTEEKPDSADTHFLLGYHYMVCGHLDLATPQFDMAAKLMPKDSVSKELAELTRNSAKTTEDGTPAEAEEEPAAETPEREPVPLEKLTGTWVSTRDAGSSITLAFKDDGKFSWSFLKDGKTSEFSGEYSINDDGLLVLDSSESQMVASVELPQETELKFVLQGGPPEDPGLAFKKN